MHQLLGEVILPAFDNPLLRQGHDACAFEVDGVQLAITTDSYVIQPLFFPGGDIGSLAVHGTVNDLAMSGATPLYLTVGFILEEGLQMETLWRVVCSMRRAADDCGVQLVTGDTKVVDRGKGDGLYINTTGVGVRADDRRIGPDAVRPGDAVLISGDLGRHGMAIMAQREGLEFESTIESDSNPLHQVVAALLEEGIEIHCLRDLTRGGLTSALVEVARAATVRIDIDLQEIPVSEQVRGACEILGLDPLHVANEGRMAVWIPDERIGRTLEIMRSFSVGEQACRIGRVVEAEAGMVTARSEIGVTRVLDMIRGEQLPRIC
jgi:hydrogenase expression/formation protein HypE